SRSLTPRCVSSDVRSDFVKPLGIFSQNQLLVFAADILSLLDFIDLMASFLHRNFMKEIGREHARLWTDKIHHIGQSPLVSLTAHIKITASKVVENWPLATKLAVLVFPFEPVNDHGNPPRSSFHKPHPQFRKRIPYPILNHPCHGNRQRHRHP